MGVREVETAPADRMPEPILRLSSPRPPPGLNGPRTGAAPCPADQPPAPPPKEQVHAGNLASPRLPTDANDLAVSSHTMASRSMQRQALSAGTRRLAFSQPDPVPSTALTHSDKYSPLPSEGALSISPPRKPPTPLTEKDPPGPSDRRDVKTEDVIVAVGRTVDAFNHRRMNDCLDMLFAAQKEEIALFTQADAIRNDKFVSALLEARQDYQKHLELAITRVIEELADGSTIPAALGQLADSVGTHFRRTERMHEKLLLELRELTSAIKSHTERTEALLQTALARPAAEPARLLTLVPSATPAPARPDPRPILEKLDDEDDDLDVGQETHA